MSTYQLSSLFFSNNDNDETTTESISASTTTATFLWLTNDIVNPSTLNPLLLSSSSSSSFKFNQTFQQQQLQNYQHHHQNRYQNNQNYNLLECQEQFFDIENFTDLNFPGERFETKAFGLDEYFKITIYIIAIIASIFGNSAVVLSVLMKRSLRVTVNLYLANLAVADILICICCMWVHLINHLTAPTYVLGPFFCKINSFAQMTCLTSSVLSLSAIACDRYMAIMYPLRTRVTKQRTGIVITCIWIVSLIISIPFYYSRRYETVKWVDYTQTTCMEDWPYTMTYSENDGVCYKKHTMKTFYYTLVTTTLFFVPVLIMITAYSAIILILWGNRLPGEANESNLRHQKKSKRKVIKMVVVVLLVFVICWLPLQLIVLYSIYFHSSNEMLPSWFGNLIFYSYFIAYSNSVFNPIIYGGFNRNFRDALYKNAFCQSLWCFNHNNNNRNDIGGNGIGTGVGGGTRKWHQPRKFILFFSLFFLFCLLIYKISDSFSSYFWLFFCCLHLKHVTLCFFSLQFFRNYFISFHFLSSSVILFFHVLHPSFLFFRSSNQKKKK
ncbi:QRFP-like peptide receptor isoform X1 [Dermatophagoides pteronyssinus]|uniref:QRFP-like peptide receptor isoform X1 n=1 Tax=Dermatophagoides pteronyssinus TaxID=6956 RepID=UPI003F66C9C5